MRPSWHDLYDFSAAGRARCWLAMEYLRNNTRVISLVNKEMNKYQNAAMPLDTMIFAYILHRTP